MLWNRSSRLGLFQFSEPPAKARKIFDIQPGDNLLILGDEEQGIAILKEKSFLDNIRWMTVVLVVIKEVDYILVHHQNSRYENAAQEMDALLRINHTQLRSIRCREGVFRRV